MQDFPSEIHFEHADSVFMDGTLQFVINDCAITITENTITDQIANCRNRALSAIHDLKKTIQFLKENYTIVEIGHFLQFTISRKTIQFLKKSYTISRKRELQNMPLSANQDLKKNYTVFQENYIQFLMIAVCRNSPLSENQDLKKNYTVFQENYEVSRDRSLQRQAVLCN